MELFGSRSGFTLVETMTAIVLLSLVVLIVSAGGVQGSLSLSRKGKSKAEGVAILKAVTEDLSTTPATLKDVADKGRKVILWRHSTLIHRMKPDTRYTAQLMGGLSPRGEGDTGWELHRVQRNAYQDARHRPIGEAFGAGQRLGSHLSSS